MQKRRYTRYKSLFYRALCCLSVLAVFTLPQQALAEENNKEGYYKAVQELKAGNTHIDYTRMRMNFTATPAYQDSLSGSTIVRDIFTARSKKDFAGCQKLADQVLSTDYTNITAHFGKMVCAKEAHQEAIARKHGKILAGLMGSIYKSGDGKKPETAFVIINVPETYSFLRVQGLKPQGQSMVTENGKVYDLMTVTNPRTQQNIQLYFDTTLSFMSIHENGVKPPANQDEKKE